MGVFVGAGYRTRLGVGFYDRVRELEALGRAVRSYRVVVVYGPRNVGKSGLVRYWAGRRCRLRVIGVEADLLRAGVLLAGWRDFSALPPAILRGLSPVGWAGSFLRGLG